MTYKIDEINIGDEVTFRSKNPNQSDYDECWTVHGKDGKRLLIHLNYLGEKVYWAIDIEEVVTRIPTGKSK
jgi:hypothetical protein